MPFLVLFSGKCSWKVPIVVDINYSLPEVSLNKVLRCTGVVCHWWVVGLEAGSQVAAMSVSLP